MSDALQPADGTYEYHEKKYRLEEHEHEKWFVYDGERHLGDIEHTVSPAEGAESAYVWHSADAADSSDRAEAEPMEGWRVALEYLIDHSR
jgi:hypothetical protein